MMSDKSASDDVRALVVTMGNMGKVLRSVRDRLCDFDDEELEIELLHDINEVLDGDPFSVRLTQEMWDEYKRENS